MFPLALASFAVLLYTYAGYPVLVALLARAFPLRPRLDATYSPSVTVCIPVYNAAGYLAAKLDSLLAQDYPADKLEILVYSDGSTDDIAAVVGAYAARDPRVRLLDAPERRGKPTALNRMRSEARGEVLLCTDARQELAPGALRALVGMLADPAVGCVSGNLILRGASGAGVYWRYESWIRRSEGGFRSMVGVTGPIYVVRKADLSPLPTDLILDDQWVPLRLRLGGRTTLFCREAEAYDDAFADQREFGRKVRTLAGNYQLFARLPRLLVPLLNPSWFETFSHKVLRLVCPWALLALFGASARLALGGGAADWVRPAFQVAWVGQILFYVGAAVGPVAGRLTGLARTFVVLNAAAVVGLGRWLRGAQRVTW